MVKLRVVGLSERVPQHAEPELGLEMVRGSGDVTVGEVFDALKQYLDVHREELRRRGPDSVRVSLVRSVSSEGAHQWRTAHH